MGTSTIKTITPPNTIIPSVDPISETSSTCGVDVGCWKNAAAGKSNCKAGGVMYVNAALKSAIIMLIPKTIVDRISFFIIFSSISCGIPSKFQHLYVLTCAFAV